MNEQHGVFLPDHLRPQRIGRRSRRGLVLASVVPIMLLALPMWRIDTVQVEGCSNLPPAAIEGLESLAGQPALGLNLEAVRDSVRAWPGIGEVQVELELPGTLRVHAEEAVVRASFRVGHGWHGVEAGGRLTGLIEVPVEPVLDGFGSAAARARGLEVAERVSTATGGRVQSVRRVTPKDYEVRLTYGGQSEPVVLHVLPEGTVAERAWLAAVASGTAAADWTDVRWSDRIVIGSVHD